MKDKFYEEVDNMGVLIGVGVILASVLSIALQLLHLNADKINLKLYSAHLFVSTGLHTIGTLICIVTIGLEGLGLVSYILLMMGLTVTIWIIQKKNYNNAVEMRKYQDRLENLV